MSVVNSTVNWIKTVYTQVKMWFEKERLPFPTIPSVLLLCEASQRSGLSAISLASSIIARLAEAGIPTGANEDGSPNLINAFVRIVSEEIVKEFKDNAKIQTQGANMGGPVQSIGILL